MLASLARGARGRGVTLGLEICNRYETNVVNTARQALRLVDGIGEDNVVIHLDTYHMNIEEDDLVRPVHEVGGRLGYVHAAYPGCSPHADVAEPATMGFGEHESSRHMCVCPDRTSPRMLPRSIASRPSRWP